MEVLCGHPAGLGVLVRGQHQGQEGGVGGEGGGDGWDRKDAPALRECQAVLPPEAAHRGVGT